MIHGARRNTPAEAAVTTRRAWRTVYLVDKSAWEWAPHHANAELAELLQSGHVLSVFLGHIQPRRPAGGCANDAIMASHGHILVTKPDNS